VNLYHKARRGNLIKRSVSVCALLLFLASVLTAQPTYLATHYVPFSGYYNGIDTTKSTFVTDLHNLIYPHTRISYDDFDETNVANFASRDTTGGQRVVTCVYSGENYVYTPPFAWGHFSREHTWCQSWMPSVNASGFTTRPEYSDQHHLFPVNQNNANDMRSNHPEGNVVSATNTYLLCKLGTDASGHTVFEPRASHKGDAARALLYMAVCYNGEGGYDWTFNHLNNVILPDSLNEAPEDLNTLIAWSHQDPPDAWEKARNEYVDSLQGNRNPFIDHPSWVDLINFNTLTFKGDSTTLAAEPTNYATSFTATLIDSVAIRLNWTDAAAGSHAPSGYLLLAKTTNSFTAPSDGTTYANDTNLSDGSAAVNIPYGSGSTYTFSGLNTVTPYYFRLYSYNGDGSARNYKTDSTVPTASATTTGTSSGHVVIYEVYGGGGNGSAPYTNDFIVLYNPTSTTASLSGWSVQYASASGTSWQVTGLNNSIVSHGYYLIQEAQGAGGAAALPAPDATDNISMSATNGKVALCNTVTALTGSSATGSAIIDFIGYGTAATYEGSGPAPAPSNTTADVRRSPGTDADNNAADFIVSAPNPKNSGSTPNPVELTSFSATAVSSRTLLVWKTATEVNNYGFDVERRLVNSRSSIVNSWCKVGFVAGNGTSNIEHQYSYTDANAAAGTYAYRLKQIDNDGTYKYSSEAEVSIAVPKVFLLNQNYPNPFNPSTTIQFTVPSDGKAVVKILNVLGQEVATVFNGDVHAGVVNSVRFNASKLSSGVYFSRLESNGDVQIKKLVLLK
jgi:endonuclease I